MQDKTSLGISDALRKLIESAVEEVVINGEPFDAKKKWIRKHSEAEGLHYETIESNLNDLFEAVKELEEHESKVIERSAKALAKECYLSEALVNQLLDKAAVVRAQKKEEHNKEEEAYKKCTSIEACNNYLKDYPQGRYAQDVRNKKTQLEQEAVRRAKEEVGRKEREDREREAQQEAERTAWEKAQWQAKLDAEHKAREKAERKAKEKDKKKVWPWIATVVVALIVILIAVSGRFTSDPFNGLPSVAVEIDATIPQAVNIKYRIEVLEREDCFHLEAQVRSVHMYDYFHGIDNGIRNESCKLEGYYMFGEWVDTGYNLFRINKETGRNLATGKVVYFALVPDSDYPVLYRLPLFQKLFDRLYFKEK